MPQITSIHLTLITGNASGAGTDGDVYLGICGREFFIDTSADDFERGASREYVFGENGNTNNPSANDPREQSLITENIARFPAYIRFQPESRSDLWQLERATVTFNGAIFPQFPQWNTNDWLPSGGIWLGVRSGLFVYLLQHID